MGDAVGALMSVLLVMAVFAGTGFRIAEKQGRNPIKWAIICAALPLVGVGMMLLIGPKSNRKGG
jgi:hypothetical protein